MLIETAAETSDSGGLPDCAGPWPMTEPNAGTSGACGGGDAMDARRLGGGERLRPRNRSRSSYPRLYPRGSHSPRVRPRPLKYPLPGEDGLRPRNPGPSRSLLS